MLERYRQIVMNNLGIKIASVVLALAIYAHVLSTQERVQVYSIPVQLSGLPDGLIYRGEVPERIPIRVQARGTELWKIRAQLPYAEIDLKQTIPGNLVRPITIEDVVLPRGSDAQVKSIVDPISLNLVIESRIERMVPVRPQLVGELASGAVLLGRVSIVPDSVIIRGAESLVLAIDSLYTREVDLSGRSRRVEELVGIETPDGVAVDRESVHVHVPIELSGQRVVGPIAVRVPPSLGPAWTTEPESVRVVLEGPTSMLEAVRLSDVTVRAVPRPPVMGEQEDIELTLTLDPTVDPHVRAVSAEPEKIGLTRRAR